MNIWQFMTGSPILAFLIGIFVVLPTIAVFTWCIQLFFRCLNIRKHGWPPDHCDADGDLKKEDENEEV